MKNKILCSLYLAILLLAGVNCLGQKNSFVANADSTIFQTTGSASWIKFQPHCKYDVKTIFTDGKKYFALNSGYEMKLIKSHVDELGKGHFKFQQTYNDIEIKGGQYILHTNNNKLSSGNGYIFTPKNISSNRLVSENAALQSVTIKLNKADLYWNIPARQEKIKKRNPKGTYYPKAAMVYLPDEDGNKMVLCYSFFIATNQPGKYGYYYINTQTSALEKFISLAYTCDGASVVTSFYGAKTILTNDVAVFGHSYDLQDDCQGSVYGVYNALSTIYNTADNNWNTSNELRSAGTSLYCVKSSYSWFKNVFGRNGHGNSNDDIDIIQGWDFGGSAPGNNAAYYFDPIPFSVDDIRIGYGATAALTDDYNALDILAHEFTHGVTHYEANLEYEKESGALNESFSDIFGEWVEKKELGTNNWMIGWDRLAVNNCHFPLRNMLDPLAENFNVGGTCTLTFTQPNTFGGKNWITTNPCIPENDNSSPAYNDACGVHTNSGVQNQMFYLLCMGGSGYNNLMNCHATATTANGFYWEVTGIGMDNAIRIAYKVLCDYLVSTSNYSDARNAWVHAAVDLFGECSFEAIQTGKAWDAVGLRAPGSSNAVTNICGAWGGTPTYFTNTGIQNVSNNCFFIIGNAGNLVQVKAGTQVHIYPGFSSVEGSHFRALVDGDCRFASF